MAPRPRRQIGIDLAGEDTAVLADQPGQGAGLLIETRDLSEEAARLGIRCPVSIFPELARRVDSSAVLVRLRDVLRATERDPKTELLRAVVLRGEQRDPPPIPTPPDAESREPLPLSTESTGKVLLYRTVTGGGERSSSLAPAPASAVSAREARCSPCRSRQVGGTYRDD